MLDPVQLESFLAVAQTRNFTEAGRRLGLGASSPRQLDAGHTPRSPTSGSCRGPGETTTKGPAATGRPRAEAGGTVAASRGARATTSGTAREARRTGGPVAGTGPPAPQPWASVEEGSPAGAPGLRCVGSDALVKRPARVRVARRRGSTRCSPR